MAILNEPKKNVSFSITQLVDEHDQKGVTEIFENNSKNNAKSLIKQVFSPYQKMSNVNAKSDIIEDMNSNSIHESSYQFDLDQPVHSSSFIIHNAEDIFESPKKEKKEIPCKNKECEYKTMSKKTLKGIWTSKNINRIKHAVKRILYKNHNSRR